MSFFCCGAPPASPDRRKKQPASQRAAQIHAEADVVANLATSNNQAQDDAACALQQQQMLEASAINALVPDELQESDYAGMCRQLLAIVEAMREAGASAVLDLPQVVVAGNQSAGKSSVIEAVCGITLPRSDGTCTRCPIEVVMSDAPERRWTATVRIRREFEPTGERLDSAELTTVKANITDPSDVEGAVRAAQDMLLAVDAPVGAGPNDRAAFSRNTIVVEIVGAPVSLALVDLPGIIHASERSFNAASTPLPASATIPSSSAALDYPALVTSLVREYASRPHSVLVAVVSCKEDLDTQSVLQLARELDPEGLRTLGVLTKADMIEEGCHGLYLDVMQGKRWPLRKGYYMLKNPSQAQLNSGISGDVARTIEASFFSQGPWSQLGPAVGGRLGVHRLRGALARLLADLSSSSMPALLADAQRQLMEVDAALSVLPRPVLQQPVGSGGKRGGRHHPEALLRHTMASLVEEVCGAVAGLLAPHGGLMQLAAGAAGGPAGAGAALAGVGRSSMVPAQASRQFWMGLTSAFHGFHAAVFAGRPAVVVNGTCFSCGTGNDDLVLPPGGGSGGPEAGALMSTPRSLLALPQGNGGGMVGAGAQLGSPGANGTNSSATSSGIRSMALEEVWALVEAHRGLELPGCAPYGAIQALVARSTAGWPAAVDALLQSATRCVSDSLMAVLQERLGRFPAAHRVARGAAHSLVAEMSAVAAEQVRTLVAMELQGPFTMNRAEFEQHAGLTLCQLREAASAPPAHLQPPPAPTLLRRNMSLQQRGSSGNGSVASSAAALSFMASSAAQMQMPSQARPQPATGAASDAVLNVVAVSLTYFTLAARRVVDYVPMFVVHNLVTKCGAELKTALAADLLAGRDPASLAGLLAEDEAVATQRCHLQRQRDTLQAALRLMRSLGPDTAM